jgi:hypothetical protein
MNLKGSPMAQTLVFDEMEKNLSGIEGKYLDKVTVQAALWAGAGVNGAWLLEQLKKYSKSKELLFMLERGIDIEWMLKEVEGAVAIEIRDFGDASDTKTLDFDAYAQVKDTPFLVDVEEWKRSMKEYGMTMQDFGKNSYVLKAEGNTIVWGVEDHNLYFSTQIAPSFAKGTALKDYEQVIQKSMVFVYVDMKKLQLDKVVKKAGQSWLAQGLGSINALTFSMPSAQQMNLTIEMDDKGENFLKQLF